ncbi:uncharacterized protein LOC129346077 [Eublepharis macularius]|uniref:Uncharacterized protein LOC129346077 n=1 Tax=Eublepharis macularius TaxID=481883 RepID=A0AA97LM13_EUBMA|nr:uncharacterized protein LOC129346077 [Eublepharis macularius]
MSCLTSWMLFQCANECEAAEEPPFKWRCCRMISAKMPLTDRLKKAVQTLSPRRPDPSSPYSYCVLLVTRSRPATKWERPGQPGRGGDEPRCRFPKSPNQETWVTDIPQNHSPRTDDAFRAWGPVAFRGALVMASESVEVVEEVLEDFAAFLEHRIPLSSDLSFGDCRRNPPEPHRSPPHFSRLPFPFQEVRVPIDTLEAHAEKVVTAVLQMMKRSFDQMMRSAAVHQSLFFESHLIDLTLANFRPFQDLWDMLREIEPSPPSATGSPKFKEKL